MFNRILNMKNHLVHIATLILLSLAIPTVIQSQSADQPPNIVLILVDDAALMDFGCYGGEAQTPNIDALANRGTVFTNYHTSPMCAPSRSMLLTGYDSHLTGIPNLPIFTPPEYASRPGYQGTLNQEVYTVAEHLKDYGYQNYVTGKWHLGHEDTNLPTKRGFDRSYILDASGADNYEQRPYLPTQSAKPPWYKDGEPTDLPDDFYSSKNLVDEMIQFIKEEEHPNKPFFSFLSFQAIHIPIQVPKAYTEKYLDVYKNGWDPIRQQRFAKAKELGLIPNEAQLGPMLPVLRKWDNLSEEDQKYMTKKMAVNAGMLDAMDEHIGRYIDFLKAQGKYDNTIFIITSDNGPEASSAGDVTSMKFWLKSQGYHQDYDRLGEKGSYGYIGPEFASAAASPSAFFKFYAGEGGLRVPLIFSGKGIPKETSQHAFSLVTDITPTILSLAGIAAPKVPTAGPMTGRSLHKLLLGEQQEVYASNEPVGMEAAGHGALYKGDFKLVRNGRPYGDGLWRLHNLKNDPGEIVDLSQDEPQIFAELIKDYDAYTKKYGVLEMGINYEPFNEIQDKMVKKIGKSLRPWFVLIGVVLVLVFGYRTYRRKVA